MFNRRDFLSACAAGSISSVTGIAAAQAPAVGASESTRPKLTHGVMSGEVTNGSAVIWARTDRPSRMIVEYATTESFTNAKRIVGPTTLPEDDFTAKTVLEGLPAGQTIFYRVLFKNLSTPSAVSIPAIGRLIAPSHEKSNIRFAWGGDTAGQGYGIDLDRGGMRIFESIRQTQPHFFVNSGDLIYADNPIPAEMKLDDGSVWKNIVTRETSKVAESLDEFRGRYRYNLMDQNVLKFNSEVPQIVQWDDHETRNNWYPGQEIDDPRYKVRSLDLLAARGKRAFLDYTPTRRHPDEAERIYRAIHRGPLLDLFLLDQRTYRGPNSPNRQNTLNEESAFMGPEQVQWLARSLNASKATWKVIASDMPIGLIVPDGPKNFEALANGDNGPPAGRELEFAWLFKTLKDQGVRNVVWLTADVHYAAAHHYDPSRASFTDFHPFWEFVGGPLNAGGFGPGALDMTFGPEVKFATAKPGAKQNRFPSSESQFFGLVDIDGKSEELTVDLRNIDGKSVYRVTLPPEKS